MCAGGGGGAAGRLSASGWPACCRLGVCGGPGEVAALTQCCVQHRSCPCLACTCASVSSARLSAAGIMHGYFLKLLGSYRSHIYAGGTGPGFTPPAGLGSTLPAGTSSTADSPASRQQPGHQRSRSASPLNGGPSSNSLAAFAADSSSSRLSLRAAAASQPGSGGGSATSSRRQSRASSSTVVPVADEGMKAHGFWFDHAGLVATHR